MQWRSQPLWSGSAIFLSRFPILLGNSCGQEDLVGKTPINTSNNRYWYLEELSAMTLNVQRLFLKFDIGMCSDVASLSGQVVQSTS